MKVKQEYLDLHKKYAPLWAKEEQERRQLWQDYLNSFSTADESGKEDENLTYDSLLECLWPILISVRVSLEAVYVPF